MKRIISLILVTLLTLSAFFCLGSCSINKSEVAILWAGEGEATNPNSLINSMERAMYIENIKYSHYGAEGNLETQLQQAKDAINNNCAALVIELITPALAPEIVGLAKAKNIPVIFFNCVVPENVLESYDKCVLVRSDLDTIAEVQAKLIADYIKSNFAKMDKNEDGKISYLDSTQNETIEKLNALLATDDYKVKTNDKKEINTLVEELDSDDVTKAELIIVNNSVAEFAALSLLQEKDYNTDKLTTHFVPIFTVGDDVDYKSWVVAGRPAIPENLVIGEDDSKKEIKNKNKEIKKLSELQEYYEKYKYLVDLTVVNESDLEEMIYTTRNVIDSGRISGTALEDIDSIALAVAEITRNFIKGNDTFKNVVPKTKKGEPATIVIEGSLVRVRYTTHSN